MDKVKVFIPNEGIDGIRRVVEAQIKHLGKYGIEVVHNPSEADVIATHGGQTSDVQGKPVVNHCHGLMWSRYPWGNNYKEANRQVAESMRQAVAHTVPSEWVAVSVRRGMLVYPEVIYHGIDADEWGVGENIGDYVLWNKGRTDFVSNDWDMQEIAKRMPDVNFKSTYGNKTANVEITKRMPFPDMKRLVKNANLYLCTARETFGIGTLEAMASGVPVVGWRWGGQEEIIIQGETGYLATPGNFEELEECVRKAIAERDRLSENCLRDAKERWAWEPRIKQYANLYKRVHRFYNVQSRPKVTVAVTAYNLDKYLPQCLDSVTQQSYTDFECLVIDDALSDTTREIVEEYAAKDERFKYVRPEKNLGLPGARNLAHSLSKGLYIRHLDADDYLHPRALETEAGALDSDRSIHIAYGPMENINEDGSQRLDGDGNPQRWATEDFRWDYQMAHINMIPSCCMVRREVFDRSGGYRLRMKKAEDAHFWCLATSFGFRAKKVTNATTMYHRIRPDSKGMMEYERDGTDGDWTAWFAHRFGASTYQEGRNVLDKLRGDVPDYKIVPFGSTGTPPKKITYWDAHDFSYPVVSIIVTVGPGHEKYLQDSLDSVMAQTYPDWECVVVNDTGKEWPNSYWDSPLCGYPWAKEVSTGGNMGTSRARNVGFHHTKGNILVWLDADDYWLPWYLEKTVAMYEQNPGIIFPDVLVLKDGEFKSNPYKEFDCRNVIQSGQYPGSSILIPRSVHEKIIDWQGGWDEKIPGYEDWDYQIAAHAIAQTCAYRVPEPLFVYRYLMGGNRDKHTKIVDDVVKYVDEKWKVFRNGEKEMGCGCRGKRKPVAATSKYSASGTQQTPEALLTEADMQERLVLLQYHGPSQGKLTYRGRKSNKNYRFSNRPLECVRKVLVIDAPYLLNLPNPGRQGALFSVVPDQQIEPNVKAFLEDVG